MVFRMTLNIQRTFQGQISSDSLRKMATMNRALVTYGVIFTYSAPSADYYMVKITSKCTPVKAIQPKYKIRLLLTC